MPNRLSIGISLLLLLGIGALAFVYWIVFTAWDMPWAPG